MKRLSRCCGQYGVWRCAEGQAHFTTPLCPMLILLSPRQLLLSPTVKRGRSGSLH